MYQAYAMPMLMMSCSSFSYSNTRGVTTSSSAPPLRDDGPLRRDDGGRGRGALARRRTLGPRIPGSKDGAETTGVGEGAPLRDNEPLRGDDGPLRDDVGRGRGAEDLRVGGQGWWGRVGARMAESGRGREWWVIPGMAPSFDGERGEGEDGGRDANRGGAGMAEPPTCGHLH
jgi:hypothetical protein